MRLNKITGTTFILIGVGLIIWAGLTAWQQQTAALAVIDQLSTPGISQASTPIPTYIDISPHFRQAEHIIPTAPPPESSDVSPKQSTTATPSPSPTAINTTALDPDQPVELRASSTATAKLSTTRQVLQPLATFSPTPPLPTPEAIFPPPLAKSKALERFGVGAPYPPSLETEAVRTLGLGWYLTWNVLEIPPGSTEAEFWQMIRVSEDGFYPDKTTIQRVAQANPGATWLIGNEPDVRWQDNVTPIRYAEVYYELYHFLKKTEPTCQIAIGGITQPTPLRYQYLEMVLAAYRDRYGEEMPIDVWNIHNFILREERDNWGVDIPPGLDIDQGLLFEIDDHDDLEVFMAQIINFRQWMADRGQRNKPLIISEYGILIPEDYGFPLERVKSFMYGTYDFMLNATDEQIGYPADDNRLVQRWAWYSLSDDRYSTGNLIDLETGELTELGQAHQEFVSRLP